MSLFGSLYTAESGLAAQATAFGNISDNVANSQTVGYKGVNTAFQDYLTTSTSNSNEPGTVSTTPQYTNDVQGTVTASSDPLAIAIAGQGFFAVQEASGESSSGAPSFASTQYYTRTGDFTQTNLGYLKNSAGEYLEGWSVTNGVLNNSTLTTVQVSENEYNPVATGTIDLSANLPASEAVSTNTGTVSTPNISDITCYDSLGNAQTVNVIWNPVSGNANAWNATITADGATLATTEVDFGSSFGSVSDGTIAGFGTLDGATSGTGTASNGTATAWSTSSYGSTTTPGAAIITLSGTLFGSTNQTIALNLGSFDGTTGVTQFAGTAYDQRSVTQNGIAAGAFSSVTVNSDGDVIANYDNGEQSILYEVPLATFNAPDSLQRVNGQAFTADQASGSANVQAESTNTAGQLVTNSVEASNVDIATEFSALIVAQNAYSANTRVVTVDNTLLQETNQMVQ